MRLSETANIVTALLVFLSGFVYTASAVMTDDVMGILLGSVVMALSALMAREE